MVVGEKAVVTGLYKLVKLNKMCKNRTIHIWKLGIQCYKCVTFQIKRRHLIIDTTATDLMLNPCLTLDIKSIPKC